MPPIDQGARARLIDLKMFLLEARRHSANPTSHGRHVAIVSLDNVCEQAMFLALDALGETLKPRPGFFDAHAAIRVRLPSLPGLRGIEVQHKGRNLAQHDGVSVDSEQLLRFSLDTDRFVRALIREVFDLDLVEIIASSAIEDERIRSMVAGAEFAFDGENYLGCFEHSVEAFDAAHAKWSGLRVDIVRWGRSIGPGQEIGGRIKELQQLGAALSEVRAFAEVATFASDMGEYHWMLSPRRAHMFSNIPVMRDDAQRALVFAFDWILRWEAFTARYPGDRWSEHSRLPAPRSAGGGPPKITTCLGIEDYPGDLQILRF